MLDTPIQVLQLHGRTARGMSQKQNESSYSVLLTTFTFPNVLSVNVPNTQLPWEI